MIFISQDFWVVVRQQIAKGYLFVTKFFHFEYLPSCEPKSRSMKNALIISILSLSAILMLCCTSTKKTRSGDKVLIGFYNVENFFDTINDPQKNDDDFTPAGKLGWNTARYREKIAHISEVVHGGELIPAVFGLAEIENAQVLADLCSMPSMKKDGYTFIHFESPDERGIDVALLYRPDAFKPEKSEIIRTVLNQPKDPDTRDVLYVRGLLKGERMHFFVNHWPSRSGGQAETEPLRMQVAGDLVKKLDSLQQADPQAKIVMMGDFNDFPTDKSIAQVLGAGPSSAELKAFDQPAKDFRFYDRMWKIQMQKDGSHWYRNEWSPLDQMITSWSLGNGKGWTASENAASIGKFSFLFFTDKDGNRRPARTYAGNEYKGGYSDHLPVFLELVHP